MPKAKLRHDDRLRVVCIMCCGKLGRDQRGIGKDMEAFIQNIFPSFQSERPYLPSGSCGKCRNIVTRFKKNGSTNFVSNVDYLSIANELRNLPIETRDPTSQTECICTVCQIARSDCTTPKMSTTVSTSNSVEEKETEEKCPKCFSLIGRGHHHSTSSCNSTKTVLDNLEKQLPPHVSEQFARRIINKAPKTASGQSVLHSGGGKPTLVSSGPVSDTPVQIPHKTFSRIQREVGLSKNQINDTARILRDDLNNRKIVEPHLKQAMIDQGKICNEYFYVDESLDLVRTDKDDEMDTPVVLCQDVPKFINFVKDSRNSADNDFIRKLGLDGGKGSLKITLNLIGKTDNHGSDGINQELIEGENSIEDEDMDIPVAGPSTSSDSASSSSIGLASTVHSIVSSGSESEAETPASFRKKIRKSKHLDSGVKQLFLLALAPNVKECYDNLKLILDALKVFEGANDFTFASDMKLFSILLGIQPHSSTYPCIWCEGKKCVYDPNAALRTLGSCREYARKFKAAVAEAESKGKKPPLANNFMCCENEPLLQGPDYTKVLGILPPPELHLMTGVSFHIFKAIAKEWGEEKAYKWLQKYVGKVDPSIGFKGKQARKFIKIADKMALSREHKFPRKLNKFIRTLKAFDSVVTTCFGNELKEGYEDKIQAFRNSFTALGISITPKVHCVFRHVKEFCEMKGCGLGVYSEQVVEASHYDFDKVNQWYRTNARTDPEYLKKILNSVTMYNGLHLPNIQ